MEEGNTYDANTATYRQLYRYRVVFPECDRSYLGHYIIIENGQRRLLNNYPVAHFANTSPLSEEYIKNMFKGTQGEITIYDESERKD